MADYYCDDGGSNTSPYDTWAKAAPDLSVLDGVVGAGDRIFVGHDHVKAYGATTTLNFAAGTHAAPIQIISATQGSDPVAYQAGGKETATGGNYVLTLQGHIRVFGIRFEAGSWFNFDAVGDVQCYDTCTFVVTQAANNVSFINTIEATNYQSMMIDWRNCTFDWSGRNNNVTANWINNLAGAGEVRFFSPTFITGGYTYSSFIASQGTTTYTYNGKCVIEDADLSWLGSGVILNDEYIDVFVRRCKLGTSFDARADATTRWGSILIENSIDGTIAAPVAGLVHFENFGGKVENETSVYRTLGAIDGDTRRSWKATGDNVSSVTVPFECPPITRWVPAGSQTITLYFASASAITKQEFYAEISSPNETANPNQTAQGTWESSRPNPLTTGTAHATTTSLWTGSPTYEYKIEFTIAPTEPGPITIRCFSCTTNAIYVDPMPASSTFAASKAWMSNGVGIIERAASAYGLTADILKSGETVDDVVGEYTAVGGGSRAVIIGG
jgi:hypothetical protein